MAEPVTIALITMAAISAGMSIHKQQEQKKAIKQARGESAKSMLASEIQSTEEIQRRRREAQGTLLGGRDIPPNTRQLPGTVFEAEAGMGRSPVTGTPTALSSPTQKRSLLGT